ncbi:hypothetical protein BRL53_05145 [Corynebacterium ulcerans]|uniref:helix-turn-helix domain-containing protein n=1 Tax=Corynebacterium ulcerans TaxID=65058 RepID=UPI000C767DA9|nr:helix-turn-helix domain-containing protein [Corynebacterium ulcerans]PLW00120.1 hypothetical protein BRL53_05145 [Corynebacterium ulcerans]
MDETARFKCDEGLWLTPSEAGKRFPGGLASSTVREWCHDGRIPGAFQTPTKRWKIPAWAIDAIAAGDA